MVYPIPQPIATEIPATTMYLIICLSDQIIERIEHAKNAIVIDNAAPII